MINKFKEYTTDYFKLSPNAFLIENEFYQDLSESLKTKLVKDYITAPSEYDSSMFLN
jgi:hypothetical protein